MIKIWIPSMPQRSYAYRQGDAQVIHDDKGHAIVIDGGEDALCNQIIRYCKNNGISHITYILSHWHYDHDRGLKLLLDSSLVVDKIYCPPPSDLTKLRDSDARDDYSRAMTRIAQAKNLSKPISYPPADAYTTITVGEIVCKIWRRSPKTSENVDYQVNNTSLCCYFPQLSYVTTGDTINAFDTFLSTLHEPVKVFKVPHHGNACTTNPCKALKALGAELCWYNHAEAAGVGIGGDSFSKWGAGYCKQYFTVLRPFYAITMIAADKTLTVMQNGSTWRFSVPYEGKAEQRWFQTSKGWWYQYADGLWAVGWKLIEGKWYYFDHNGWMQTGWIRTNGYWYYLGDDGAMLTGWLERNGLFYLEPEAGKNQGHAYMSETATIDGKTYHFDAGCYATEVQSGTATSGRPDIKQNSGFRSYNVSRRSDPIMYIVVHYTGAEGTAKNNVDYFNGGNRSASADFFVGHSGEIWQYNPDIEHQYSWHCGGGRQSSRGGTFYGKCKNANSIGVELCTHKTGGEWIFTEQTVDAARILVRYLMETYNVKQKNIIRHYDVTGKACPNVYGFIGDNAPKWQKFKASLSEQTAYDDPPQIYRVRKTWAAADTQVGAFAVLENARTCAHNWGSEYHVFDKDGQMIE